MHQRLKTVLGERLSAFPVRVEGIYQVRLNRGLAAFTVFVNDLATRKCVLSKYARGTKLGEAANKPESTPKFNMIFSNWENIWGKSRKQLQ